MNDTRHYAILMEEEFSSTVYEFESAAERDRITDAYCNDPMNEDDIGNVPVFHYFDVKDNAVVGVGMWDLDTY